MRSTSLKCGAFGRKFLDSLQHWIAPGERSPFCSVRRYSRMCFNACRGRVSLPRLRFTEKYGQDFFFDGKLLSVTSMTKMYHAVYRETERILHQELLFGASEDVLGRLKKPEEMAENPHQQVTGRGVLVSEMQAAWNPVKFIMRDEKLCSMYFSIDSNGVPVPQRGAWEQYLRAVERFKEHFYFLFHQIPGMPRRGSEETRAKIVDMSFRQRNIMYLFNRLACVGDYNKTSRNTGQDKLTLHFFARPLENILRRFQASVASINAWAIDQLLPPERVDPHHHCYLLSSMGNRWTSERLSQILRRLTSEHLPGRVSLDMNSLRHILPGIAEHYRISDALAAQEADNVMHAQLGHTSETGDRLYARSLDDHPRLTSSVAHRTMAFCDLWQELLGFSGDLPDEHAALSLQSLYARQRPHSGRSLSMFWTIEPSAVAVDTDTRNYQDLSDRIAGMERSIAGLAGALANLTQMMPAVLLAAAAAAKPLVTAPHRDSSAVISTSSGRCTSTDGALRAGAAAVSATVSKRIEPRSAQPSIDATGSPSGSHTHILDDAEASFSDSIPAPFGTYAVVDLLTQEPEVRPPKRARTCTPEYRYHSEPAGAVVEPDISPPASVTVGLGRSNDLADAADVPVDDDALNLTDSEVSALTCAPSVFFIMGLANVFCRTTRFFERAETKRTVLIAASA
ncbi:hypothetical protein BDR07DRAFT_98877 [Suillus spraguei]|nr:hypothetical protein BDR07DRAFT_98877 [Suillus spraguei]